MATARTKVLILGAAGRDFHNFNIVFRADPAWEVVAFTATQIPNIDARRYPPELAGPLYPNGIPIVPESQLEALVRDLGVAVVLFSYSDVSHEHVMHLAARANAAGADYMLLGATRAMLRSSRPVISVCAARTGCGKSQTARKVAAILRAEGVRACAIRHPMAYGDLVRQRVQRFATVADMQIHRCTVEEMEEYEHYIVQGMVVYAGVDYEQILRAAEGEADVLVWDGGNNDTPFVRSDLEIAVLDPLRPGHEMRYYPGEVNLRSAQVLVVNKVSMADPAAVECVLENVRSANPKAAVILADSTIRVDRPEVITGRSVLVVEDGPTTTHGGMAFGAGLVAAREHRAASIVDPRKYATGPIAEAYRAYPHMDRILPALGYYPEQLAALEETINRAECDAVVIGTPIDLRRFLKLNKPAARVTYELSERPGQPTLKELVTGFLRSRGRQAAR